MTKPHKIPSQRDLYWPVIQAFRELKSSSRQPQLVEKVCEIIKLSEEDTLLLRGDGPGTEISYRISWVKDTLKRVGILINLERGLWTLTKKGRGITSKEEAGKIWDEVQALWKKAQRGSRTEKGSSGRSDADVQEPEYLDDAWVGEVLNAVAAMESDAFERLAKILLSKLNFDDLVVTPRTRDQGIDILGVMKEGDGIVCRPVLVQCKRYKPDNKVTPKEIRDFRGTVQGRSADAIFITSGTYTDEAHKEALREGAIRINLVDGEQLAHMLKKAGLGVEVELREYVTVKPDFFTEDV